MPPLNAHTDGLTAEQICLQCESLAGNPNLHLAPSTGVAPTTEALLDTTPAYIWLNEIIQHELMTKEWPFLETGANIAIGSRETALPADYWRQRFDHGLFVLEAGNRHRLTQYTAEQWHSVILSTPTPQGRPRSFYIDKARQSLYVDPIPDTSYTCEIHYLRTISRITAITQIPGTDPSGRASLPYPGLLMNKLLEWYYRHQSDNRLTDQRSKNAEMMAEVRASAYEPQDNNPSIPLDTSIFRTTRYWGD